MPNFYHALNDKEITSKNDNKLQDITILLTLFPRKYKSRDPPRLRPYNTFSNHDVYTLF